MRNLILVFLLGFTFLAFAQEQNADIQKNTQSLTPFKSENGKWGIIDEKEKEVVAPKYDSLGVFSEGLIAASLDNKWGFIDKTGKKVIPLKYDAVDAFSKGYARVKVDDNWWLIDKNGKESRSNKTKCKKRKIKGKIINRKVDTTSTNTYMVEYDFQTGTFNKNNLKVKVNNPVVFKVVNINRLAYNIHIKSIDSVVGYSDLSDIKDLLKKTEIDKMAEEITSLEKDKPQGEPSVPVDKYDFKTINGEKESKPSVKKVLPTLIKEINSAQNKLLEHINANLDSIDQGKKLSSMPATLPANLVEQFEIHFESQKRLTELYLSILEKHHTIMALWHDYLTIREVINNPLLTQETLKVKEDILKSIYEKFRKNEKLLNDFNLKIKQFQNLYAAIKSNSELADYVNYGGRIKLLSIVENMNTEVQFVKEQIDVLKFERFYLDLVQIKELMNTSDSLLFEYVSDPIQPYQDIVVFDVDIQKKEKENALFYNERKFSHKEFTRFGIRYDVSLGVGGSLHSRNQFYSLHTDSSGQQIITQPDRHQFSPSFIGFFTTSYRSATHWTVGTSVGLGISADQGTVTFDNFFVGLSLIAGKDQRVNLTGGVSVRSIFKLNSTYAVGDKVSGSFVLDNITSKSYGVGGFVSISYNLTKGVKDNIKQARGLLK